MRRENLPSGGHGKVILKPRRDRSKSKASQLRDVMETYHSDVIECFIWKLQET